MTNQPTNHNPTMTEAICIITVLTWAISLVAIYRRGREDGYDEGYDVARNRNGADRVRENRRRQQEAEDLAKSVAAMRRKAREEMAAN